MPSNSVQQLLLSLTDSAVNGAIPVVENEFTPRAIDLFSGCGGLTQGLKEAGFRVIGAVEKDKLAADTYTSNHPEVRIWREDIRDLSPRLIKRTLRLRTGQLDLLAGCPPCQGFSSVRTLKGKRSIDDPNNALLFRFLLFIKELKPKAVMMENVPGLAEDRDRMGRFLEVLASLGYAADQSIVKVLNTADYGVPQRRRRMILLTSRMGHIPFASADARARTVRDAIGALPPAGQSGDPLHDVLTLHAPEVLDRIQKIPQDGGSRTALGEANQLPCHQRADGFKDIYGRMAWDKVAPTITGGCINPSKGRFLHPVEHRAITLREAALLQTFPSDYKILLNRGKFNAALLIGNALPPEFVKRHALHVKAFLYDHCSCLFSSDLTEQEWQAVKPLLPETSLGRPRVASLRAVINALLYRDEHDLSTTTKLPRPYPPVSTVNYYYYAWRRSGLWRRIKELLAQQKAPHSSAADAMPSVVRTARRPPLRAALPQSTAQIELQLAVE